MSQSWIALYRYERPCNCSEVLYSDCETCRASWSWHDGAVMNWWNWFDTEPIANDFQCGFASPAAWGAQDCSKELTFICERGFF